MIRGECLSLLKRGRLVSQIQVEQASKVHVALRLLLLGGGGWYAVTWTMILGVSALEGDEKASWMWRTMDYELAHWEGGGSGRSLEIDCMSLTLLFSSKMGGSFLQEISS